MTSTPRRSKITPEREREFYVAALDLLREGGYEALTMEGIAARTRCGKSTLYRQWRTKPQLVCAALRGTRCVKLTDIDTGSLAGDLRAVARGTSANAHRDTALMHALVHAAQQNPDLLSALRENLIEPEIAEIDAIVRRAVDRGEVAPDNPAVEFVAVQLFGVMRARPLLRGVQADEDYLVRFLEASVLPALGVPAGRCAPAGPGAPAVAEPPHGARAGTGAADRAGAHARSRAEDRSETHARNEVHARNEAEDRTGAHTRGAEDRTAADPLSRADASTGLPTAG